MKKIYSIALLCGLGAIDGLLVGVVAEGLRLVYERYRIEVIIREAAERNQPVGYLPNPAMDLAIPIVCLVTFAIITPLISKYLINRPGILLVLWTVTAGIALAAGYVMTSSLGGVLSWSSVVLFCGVSYIIFRLWKDHPRFLPLFWQVTGVSIVLAFAAGSQLLGLFVVQRHELRQPLTWLFCLVVVLLVNFVYGLLIRLSQNPGRATHVYD